jgi:hypothetical protein
MFEQSSTAMIGTFQRIDAYSYHIMCLTACSSAVVQADAAASMTQQVVSAAAVVALLLAPPALAFGPVSVKLDDIVVNRVECAGGQLCCQQAGKQEAGTGAQHVLQRWSVCLAGTAFFKPVQSSGCSRQHG